MTASDRIRLSLALGGDAINKLLGGDGTMDWYYRPWKVLDVTDKAYRTTLHRMLGAGEITKTINTKGEVIYRMAAKGEIKHYRDYPLARLRVKPWDGVWRMVIYDLPCQLNYKRNQLRDKLVELGFGCYQKSVYVTPLDIMGELKDYLAENSLAESVVIFEGNRIFGEDIKKLANKLWSLDDINFNYLELERKIVQIEKEGSLRKEHHQLWTDFTTVVLGDPFLPEQFLPSNWAGERVKAKMVGKYR